MDIRPYNGFAANDDSDTLSGIGRSGSTLSSSPRDLRDDQMDQIRDLLFGEYKRQMDSRFSAIEQRLSTLEARVQALASETVAARRDTLSDLSRGIDDLGAYIRGLGRPGPV